MSWTRMVAIAMTTTMMGAGYENYCHNYSFLEHFLFKLDTESQ